ncbi:carboxymuconolactone decarboxylase [Fomitiporia mediterranea MF3/22]|uniref:carboxymuconolactone decarboxylase n=1 Tax=Fomitiporia mediterranea (strain MF3/22) TaxID=694068 RepID=UPI00044077DF|nr:carboxymuconolactone decarboxylase [Fomitiporia mediterranea MF3/22]EJD02786.1 carboxymuconolactone decarboxylase [Fomitiporia mediterranea MF3/22]
MPTNEEVRKFLYDEGMKQRKKIFGDAFVDNALSGISDFSRAGQELVTEAAFGTIWTRPGLSHKERSLICVTLTAAMSKEVELTAHIRGALNNGLTEEELNEFNRITSLYAVREVMLQIMVYCGAPVGMVAFRVADAAIQKWKAEQGK